ncbi:hypothetical protein MUK42_27397 [Musa troglodytarum]|uniref:Uncharacterized protein n=1 Tax=Musa troglodytarum TaxID=320322 RepID=A0A9E7JRX0_9LILI|nr:hypothetical protein MUK42_27397 [Musa troglodytarum]
MAASSGTSTKLATLHSEAVQGTPLLGELETAGASGAGGGDVAMGTKAGGGVASGGVVTGGGVEGDEIAVGGGTVAGGGDGVVGGAAKAVGGVTMVGGAFEGEEAGDWAMQVARRQREMARASIGTWEAISVLSSSFYSPPLSVMMAKGRADVMNKRSGLAII